MPAAARGVKLAVLEPNTMVSPKLSNQDMDLPKSEFDLLAESWELSPPDTYMTVNDENATLFLWGEDFQDLRNWCVEPTAPPSECVFPVGELANMKTLGLQHLGGEISDGKNEIPVYETVVKNIANQQSTLPPEIKLTNIMHGDIKIEPEEVNIPSTTNKSWLQRMDINDTKTGNSKIKKLSLESPKGDFLPNFEVGEAEKFDLLSYLCEDNDSTSTAELSVNSSSNTKNNEQTGVSEGRPRRSCRLGDSQFLGSPKSTTSVSTSDSRQSYESCVRKKRKEDSDSEDQSYEGYRESRQKNNEASRKSRMNKKVKEHDLAMKAETLEKGNRVLKMKVEELEKLVMVMRAALLKAASSRHQ